MGASGWDYRVPYQEDLQAALDALRVRAFGDGDYWRGSSFAEAETPKTIEELLARNGTEGAHSILDIHTARPVSREQLDQTFGTDKPTASMIEELYHSIFNLHGNFLIIYDSSGEDAEPTEILFFGISGD